MPEVTVRFWAGAQRAAGHQSERLSAATLGALREQLAARPELGRICAVASFLVDGQQASDATVLSADAEVDVLPPFAGGAGGSSDVGLHVWVSGQVQGVGFRDWTRSAAREVGLIGWVNNASDGRVEIVASGPRAACERLLDALRGPDAPGDVQDVREEWGESHGGERFEAR